MSHNQSILVGGGAGYLGCALVEALLNRGYAVTVFDRLFFGDAGCRKCATAAGQCTSLMG
jgi:nucleoside-diphosphate-sugar epimerase